jgi:hypothetical protein
MPHTAAIGGWWHDVDWFLQALGEAIGYNNMASKDEVCKIPIPAAQVLW